MSEEVVEGQSEVEIKIAIGKQKKDMGDEAYKTGQLKDALRSYHESLLYLAGIDKNALKAMSGQQSQTVPDDATGKAKEKTEVDEIMEKIYANMSACHIKLGNWKRAEETANKALSKNGDNYKAMFRKATALGRQFLFEESEKVFQLLIKKNPDEATAYRAELERFRAIDAERERVYREKQRGFLVRGHGPPQPSPASTSNPSASATPVASTSTAPVASTSST